MLMYKEGEKKCMRNRPNCFRLLEVLTISSFFLNGCRDIVGIGSLAKTTRVRTSMRPNLCAKIVSKYCYKSATLGNTIEGKVIEGNVNELCAVVVEQGERTGMASGMKACMQLRGSRLKLYDMLAQAQGRLMCKKGRTLTHMEAMAASKAAGAV